MTTKELFVKYHWRQTLFLGFLTVLTIGFHIFVDETRNKGHNFGAIKGEATRKTVEIQSSHKVISYQQEAKKIVVNYLNKRSLYDKPHESWLFLINNTKFELLQMSVPEAYRELHLLLATALDKEKALLTKKENLDLNEANELWGEILEQYFWLN